MCAGRFERSYELLAAHQFLFAGREVFYRDVWPFVAEKDRDTRADLFRSLKLFADLGRGERVIDPPSRLRAVVARAG